VLGLEVESVVEQVILSLVPEFDKQRLIFVLKSEFQEEAALFVELDEAVGYGFSVLFVGHSQLSCLTAVSYLYISVERELPVGH